MSSWIIIKCSYLFSQIIMFKDNFWIFISKKEGKKIKLFQ
jgi:hypothetical protein